jgi:hypothetical protein
LFPDLLAELARGSFVFVALRFQEFYFLILEEQNGRAELIVERKRSGSVPASRRSDAGSKEQSHYRYGFYGFHSNQFRKIL